MSLANYTGVVASVMSWMHRSDITTSQADDFIALLESDFSSNVRVRQMEASTSITSTAGYLVHPTNWIGWKIVKGTSGSISYVLGNVSDEIATDRVQGDSSSTPSRFFKVRGNVTYLYPGTSSGVVFPTQYYEAIPALTASATTNWLLTKYPGAYLYGSLVMSNMFVSDSRFNDWVTAYNNIVEQIKSDSKKQEWSGQALRMETDLPVTP